ncbi:MAG TPA: hypothetical protein PK409_03135 [Thermosynergistes sp.]|nr:hypothetical protein [Thermosynergistes sp.]
MKKVKLREIAHSRAGDKGDIVNISVIAYDMQHYDVIREQVTVEKVKEHFKEIAKGDIVRYELPNLGALNFVMHNALAGGVTRSLRIDIHGKTLSSAMLELEVNLSS